MRICAVSGKKTKVGVSGRHRHSGAWAMKAPSSKKVWYPNLHNTTVKIDGVSKRIKVSTKALRQLKKNGAAFSRAQAKSMGLI